ncbi:hypothetical protein ACS8E3_02155 [Psychrobacter sp. 2Y5]|uniref:hypothetical protein n=1 Tax=unclassified Psychrobacter TaxID=196806 RepID=UPI003F48356B
MNYRDNNRHNHSQMSSEENDIKPSINSRSLSVYEQYLKKTMASINQDLNKSTNNAANYPQSSLEDYTQDNGHRMIATSRTVVATDESSNNSARLLTIIGVSCALLLLALVIILFSATDTLIDRITAVDSQMSEVSNNISVIGKENSLANTIAMAQERATNAANARELARVKHSLNSLALNAELAKTAPEAKMTTRVRSMQLGETDVEPTISYDSFKAESQKVVYRDSSY